MKNICNLFILDTSGSMAGERISTALEGLNENLLDIKSNTLEGINPYTSVWTFNSNGTQREVACFQGSKKVKPNVKSGTSGMTALYDCICTAVDNLPKGFDGGIISIYTDGQENNSREFGLKDVQKRIRKLRKKGWAVTFVGADEESLQQAEKMGVSRKNMARYNNERGLRSSLTANNDLRSTYGSMVFTNSLNVDTADTLLSESLEDSDDVKTDK